jgi:hypothetical protein
MRFVRLRQTLGEWPGKGTALARIVRLSWPSLATSARSLTPAPMQGQILREPP